MARRATGMAEAPAVFKSSAKDLSQIRKLPPGRRITVKAEVVQDLLARA